MMNLQLCRQVFYYYSSFTFIIHFILKFYDLLFLDLKISKEVAQTTALDVIQNHKSGNPGTTQTSSLPLMHQTGLPNSDKNAKSYCSATNSGPSRTRSNSGRKYTTIYGHYT